MSDLQLVVYAFTSFGKKLTKEKQLHPDTFIQLALQLAYYRLHGRWGPILLHFQSLEAEGDISTLAVLQLVQLVNFELIVALPPYPCLFHVLKTGWESGGGWGDAKSDFWHPPRRTYLSDPVYLPCLEKWPVNLGLLQPSKHFGLFVVFFAHGCIGSDLGWGATVRLSWSKYGQITWLSSPNSTVS